MNEKFTHSENSNKINDWANCSMDNLSNCSKEDMKAIIESLNCSKDNLKICTREELEDLARWLINEKENSKEKNEKFNNTILVEWIDEDSDGYFQLVSGFKNSNVYKVIQNENFLYQMVNNKRVDKSSKLIHFDIIFKDGMSIETGTFIENKPFDDDKLRNSTNRPKMFSKVVNQVREYEIKK